MEDLESINRQVKKKFKFKMPGAFVILFILTILAVISTWIIPAGSYSKLSYDQVNHQLKVVDPYQKVTTLPATQAQLDKLGVKIEINQFTSGSINQAISVPNTYQRLKQKPKGIGSIPVSMVQGVIEAVDIMVFIFVLGGLIGVVKASGAFESGLIAMTKKNERA
jgi:uncharacterized ion transporter superfamily protein YfcC